MTRRKKDLADLVADQILGPAPPKRSRGRPPGRIARPPTEAELERNRAASAAAGVARVNPGRRPRTVDAAWAKAMARAGQMVRGLVKLFRHNDSNDYLHAADDLEKLAKDIEAEPAPPPDTR